MVGFTSIKLRNEILQKVKMTRKDKLKIDKQFSRIFYNERLTKTNQEISYNAHQLVKENKIKATWTYKGEISIKTEEKSSPLRISTLDA